MPKITMYEIAIVVKRLATGKAAGPNELPSEILKVAITRIDDTNLPFL